MQSWDGIVANGVQRPPYRFKCADAAPCSNITVNDVYLWSSTGESNMECFNAYGTGACLKSGATSSYTAVTTAYTQPASYSTFAGLTGDLTAGFTSTASIPAP